MVSAVDDGTRPGVFTIPIVNPRNTSTFDLAALLAHEGMPGHHFDGGIRLENKVPDFRRRMWVNAFGEGWGSTPSTWATSSACTRIRSLMGRYHVRAVPRLPAGGRYGPARDRNGRGSVRSATSSRSAASTRRRATAEVLRYMVVAGPGARLQDRRAHDTRPARRAPSSGSARASTCARSTTPSSRRATCRSAWRASGWRRGWKSRRGNSRYVRESLHPSLVTHRSSRMQRHWKTSRSSTSPTPSPGPFCSTMLADFGAQVIKLEPPGFGDTARGWGIPIKNGETSYFVGLHRNKRGIVVDLKKPEGKELFFKLVEKCDVVIENFRVDALKRLGLDYEEARKRNKGIIYCSISGSARTARTASARRSISSSRPRAA